MGSKDTFVLVPVKYGPVRSVEVTSSMAGWVRLNLSYHDHKPTLSYPLGLDEAEKVANAMLEAVTIQRQNRPDD